MAQHNAARGCAPATRSFDKGALLYRENDRARNPSSKRNLGDADRSRLHRGAEIETLARQYRLTKAPAMVVDGRAVIYGVNDVEHARAIYRAWRARKGG